jgi:hypothetical protein
LGRGTRQDEDGDEVNDATEQRAGEQPQQPAHHAAILIMGALTDMIEW